MTQVGTVSNPLRVAIIGAGPAGFYAAERLFKENGLTVEVDMYDRLPTPFGLVRNGVAPDHQKIKSVTKVFDRIANKPGFRFFGYVELGRDIQVADLRRFYHQIVYTTGAETDKMLNIPGIELKNSHAATAFVGWYNGHPDYRACQFDLSQERVAVIGVGNVAVDVCRVLCRTPDALAKTDIADYALEALRHSRVKEVYMLGRRGPAQAAFSLPEAKELGQMEGADVVILPEEAALDPLSQALLADADRATIKKVELIQQLAAREPRGKSKRLHIRFLTSPTALCRDEYGGISGMRLVKNELYQTESGGLRPRATDVVEEIAVGLVFRSIGYRGIALPDVPFNESWGVIHNEQGRVIDPDTKVHHVGEYTAGWIKRGPTGVIGTNKPDAVETVTCMLADLAAGNVLQPTFPAATAVAEFIGERQPDYFSYEDWQYQDEVEMKQGESLQRPRMKLTTIDEMVALKWRKAT